jgi:hypothetical protein
MSSSCSQRALLREQYLHAVNAYGEAIGQEHSHRRSDDQEARRLTKQREEACRSALRALKHHLTEHGCDADREALSLHAARDRALSLPALRAVRFDLFAGNVNRSQRSTIGAVEGAFPKFRPDGVRC